MYSSTNEILRDTAEYSVRKPKNIHVVESNDAISPLVCIDLFAGAGGFSLAAKRAGLHVAAAVEIDEHACATYIANLVYKKHKLKRPKLYSKDILKLDPELILNENFSNGLSCDVVLGGPPCQGFSVHRINGAGVDDPRNTLILRYFEYVKCLKPKVFLMENVPGILWPRHEEFLKEFMQESKKAGYRIIGPISLDARNYGIPQRRKRVFILGVRDGAKFDDSVWPPKPTHEEKKAQEKGILGVKPWVPAATVFIKPLLATDENNVHMNHTQELIEVFKATPINGGSRRDSGRILTCHEGHDGHTDVYGRIDPTVPGPTMTTACINPSKGRFVHPIEHHGITARHAARFQTFPEDYVFKGGITAAGRQIGNAVPVKLGEILLRSITLGLERENIKSEGNGNG
ncbi:DNA cytosine methyltransferase [Janthinobacterium sp. LB3P112]|uniref:DNA cytosine methyltransferase n=1 Tax=Janthinobacterium sp. LB3P112 TaxID=3424196 RepID=UPI003F1F8BB3